MNGATLRLKMSVQSVKNVCDGEGKKSCEEIVLTAVYGPDGSANKQWSKWTPAGNLTFQVNNPDAFGRVLPGQFLFVDLIPTDKDAI
jgi:hypothetical protein